MTQILDKALEADARTVVLPVRSRAPAMPAGETKSAVFAIAFGIAFALLYTVFERLNWPLFTYHPVSGVVDFGRQPEGVGPPMFWYGWIVLAAAAALAVAWAATLAPARALARTTFFCCALAVLWPAALTALRIYITNWATFDADFLNSVWVAAGPAVIAAALVTWLAGARLAERTWTSFLLLVPVAGLAVLAWSLQPYFVR
jgi:hypothetical protein